MSDQKKDVIALGAARALGAVSKAAGQLQTQMEKFSESANDGTPLEHRKPTTNEYRTTGIHVRKNRLRFMLSAWGTAAAPYLLTEVAASVLLMYVFMSAESRDQFMTITMAKVTSALPFMSDVDFDMLIGEKSVTRSAEDLAALSNTWWKQFPKVAGCALLSVLPAYFAGRWYDKGNVREGIKTLENEFVRGAKVTDAIGLNRIIENYENSLKEKGLWSKSMIDLDLGGVKLPSMREVVGFLILGTTGAGKTVAFKNIAKQVRLVRQKMILHDPAPEFVKCMLEDGDLVFNPYDARFPSNWDIWGEFRNEYDYKAFAAALVTIEPKNPWIGENARMVLAGLLKVTKTFEELDAAIKSDVVAIESMLMGTTAQGLISSNPKSIASVQPVLSKLRTTLTIFGDLKSPPPGTKKFSFRDWVANNDDRRWIFLTNRADQRDNLNPLYSLVFDIIARELLSQVPNNDLPKGVEHRRVWIVQEEAACLPPIPTWPDLTAQGRKFGACWITMIQDPAQLEAEDKYGKEKAKALYQNHNTWLIFRSTNAETATLISDQIGTYEQWEKQEGVGAGPDADDPDSRNWRAVLQERQAILPSEIQTLPDLHCFLMMFGPTPAAKITIPWVDMIDTIPAFVPASWIAIKDDSGQVIDGEAVVVKESSEFVELPPDLPVRSSRPASSSGAVKTVSPAKPGGEAFDLDEIFNLGATPKPAEEFVEEEPPVDPPEEEPEVDNSWKEALDKW